MHGTANQTPFDQVQQKLSSSPWWSSFEYNYTNNQNGSTTSTVKESSLFTVALVSAGIGAAGYIAYKIFSQSNDDDNDDE